MKAISTPPFVIGVAGGSGSGKSTVSQQVLASFGADMVSVVMQDDYYRDQTDLAPDVRRKQNYDHPNAFDWPLLVRHVQALRNGAAIEMPVYDFTIDNRSNKTILVEPAPVVVIEGLFAKFGIDAPQLSRADAGWKATGELYLVDQPIGLGVRPHEGGRQEQRHDEILGEDAPNTAHADNQDL